MHGRLTRPRFSLLVPFAFLLLSQAPIQAQVKPEQAADMLLQSARRAYNDKNFDFAQARFREYLSRFGGQKDAPAARFGLALCLIEGPQKNYPEAVQLLQPLAGDRAFSEHPFVLYYLGLARRSQGVQALAQAVSQPAQAEQHRAAAKPHFEEAAKHFAAAAQAFADAGKAARPDLAWQARARCDQAEMLLRLHQPKDAQAALAGLLDDPALQKTPYHGLVLYYHGFACFLQHEYLKAGRALSLLTPFTDPVFGTHARFLLARVHQAQGERPEAQGHFEGVLADYEKQKQAAAEKLNHPDQFKNDPEEKSRLERLAHGPAPDHVLEAGFFLAVLQYEDGKFAEALAHLDKLRPKLPAGSLLAQEAQLRQGFCQVQLKQPAEAQKTLLPLVDQAPRLADQALLWTARAQVAIAQANNGPAREQALRATLDTFRKAGDRANQLAQKDDQARTRRGEILLELADTQQEAGQPREAAGVYNQILNDKLLPGREDEVVQHLIVAWQQARDLNEADRACQAFQQAHPTSVLLPAVLFRQAENAFFRIQEAEKKPSSPDRDREVQKLTEEAIKRYQLVVEKYPELEHAGLARYGLGLAFYRKGDLDHAREAFDRIDSSARNGELALVPYHLADILLRQAPEKTDDAVAAGKLEEQLKKATELLEGMVAAQPNGKQTPDALFKLGYCQQRLAGLLAQPPDQARALAAARTAYEQLLQRFPSDPLQPAARFERCKCLALAKDTGGAINDLRRFTQEPLDKCSIAPMAILQLATLLRGQNKPQEAADLLARCRQAHEAELAKDPQRADWVPLLQYHHGVTLREAGKLSEARTVFDQLARQAGKPQAAQAALRLGQCLKEEAERRLADGQRLLSQAGSTQAQAAARTQIDQALQELRQAAEALRSNAMQHKDSPADVRARMLYDAAWASRRVFGEEVEQARMKMRRELQQKQQQVLTQKASPGQPPPEVPLPEVALSRVPVQPAETQAQASYQALIQELPDAPLATDALFELAELLSLRGQHEPAVKLLREALEKEPSPEMTDRVRLRLGDCLLQKGDIKAALAQLEPVAANSKSPQSGQARYRLAECYLKQGDPAAAVKQLTPFRDDGAYQNVPGLSDRCLLRLGYACAQLKQWDASRQAYELLVNRFGNSPWVPEARYGIGWAQQNQQQLDAAIDSYNHVVNSVVSELAARAQLNIGLCRLAQKRYAEASTALLIVPYTYAYPSLSALALVEAARALAENKQPEQAIRLLKRVLRDHPGTESAAAARDRLAQLKKSP